MIRYLNSPLKVAGILFTVSGILLLTLTNSFYNLMGVSISFLGLIVLATEWMLQKTFTKQRRSLGFELFLTFIICIVAILMLLDYMGIISMQYLL